MSAAAQRAKGIGRGEFITLVALVMSVNALAIDIVLPALLIIGDVYAVAVENDRQWLITAYLLPFGIGQLLFGTLSDTFGRRPVMAGGLVLYASASLLAPLAGSFETLLALRAFTGLGAAAARVAVVAAVRDRFAGREMAAVMSVVMFVFMAIPVFAPAIGQLILLVSGWPAIFLAMAAFGVVLIVWLLLRLPESVAPEHRRPFGFRTTVEAFRVVLSTRRSMGYTVAQALFFGCLFGFVNAAPQIYLGIYDLGALFPLVFSIGGLAVAAGSLANARLVRRLGMRRLSHGALAAFLVGSALLVALAVAMGGRLPLPVFVICSAILFMALGVIGTNFNAIALEPLGHHAGTASAVFGFIQIAGAAVIGAAIGQAFDGTIVPVLAGFVLSACLSFAVVWWAERGRMFTERELEPA